MGRKRKRGRKKGQAYAIGPWEHKMRQINGEERHCHVRKMSNGTEQVRLMYPKKGGYNSKAIPLDAKAKKLRGSAKARYLHSKRPPVDKTVDEQGTSEILLEPKEPYLENWRKHPDRIDLKGIDDKK